MKKIAVEQMETGMLIGKAVCTADGTLLFTPGTIVDASHKRQLLDAGIEYINVMGAETVTVSSGSKERNEVIRSIKDIFRNIQLTNQLEQAAVRKTVNDMLRRVLRDRCVMLHLTEVRKADTYMFVHSVNVCMLSMIAGLFLKLKGEQLKNLGLAALFHDIGLSRIPADILYKTAQLSGEEFEEIKRHPVYGFDLLKSCRQFDDDVCQTALQHHERLDGSGYPFGIKGQEMGLFSRIVAVADVFDALLADRPFRKAFFPHQAVEIILNSPGQFDPEVLKVFAENVAIYPLGSVVKLNNGEVGVVVDMNRGQQTRPVVRIMFDSNRQKLQFIREVDLSKMDNVFIARILREEQLEQIIG